MKEKSTGELFNELKAEPKVENFISKNKGEFSKPIHEYLSELLRERNLTRHDVAFTMFLDDSYIHHIFSGAKNASRERLIGIARVFNLNLEQTQYLLRYGGYAILYPRKSWDAVIISAIEHNMTFAEMNDYLKNLGETQIVVVD